MVRIFAGWRKGAQVSGVRGSGGGWSEAGSQGEGGEKKNTTTTLFIKSRRKVKKGRKGLKVNLFVYP